jgi:hypothetical protein
MEHDIESTCSANGKVLITDGPYLEK